jgi:hypothetical protein
MVTKEKAYLPFYSLDVIEKKRTPKWVLRSVSFLIGAIAFIGIFITLDISASGITTANVIVELIGSFLVGVGVAYLFGTGIVFTGIRFNYFVWYTVTLKNDSTEISLLCESEVDQETAYTELIKKFEK